MHTSAINAIGAGLNVFVAVMLVLAALFKMRDIQPVERLLVATLPRRVWRFPGIDSRGLGRAAALIEAAGGVALLAAGRAAYPVVSAALVVPLLAIVAVVVRARLPAGFPVAASGSHIVEPAVTRSAGRSRWSWPH